jgi:sugar porter (SP) family MFS transporter
VKSGAGWRRNVAAVICSLGGTTFGYDLGALSGATNGLTHAFGLSPALLGLTISASLWAAIVASVVAGRLADSLGRRGLIAVCASLYAAAALTLALPIAYSWMLVLVLRFAAGMSIGGFVVGCPLYLAEIAPIALRGRFVGWFQAQIGAGVVLAFAASALLAHVMPEAGAWKWCFGLGAVPSLCLLMLLSRLPEEPHWLAAKGRWCEAAAQAERLGLPRAEWLGQSAERLAPVLREPALRERLFSRRYLRALLLATSVALFNQLCGVNILRVYLLDLLAGAGMGHQKSHNYGLLIACLNLVALVIGMRYVDKLGRRPLLIAGSAGMAACLFALGTIIGRPMSALFYLAILVGYNTFFAFSQGAVAWAYLSELFPFPVRGKGQGYGAFIHWVTNAALIGSFPVLSQAAPRETFMLLGGLMVLQVVVVLFWYPETKGTRLGEIVEADAATRP